MIDKDMDMAFLRGSIKPGNSFQANIIEPKSPHTAWQIGTSRASHQAMEQDDKNDSGITSGSDCQSSSPGSDSYHSPTTQNAQIRFYSAPIFGINPYSHHPLTPPNSEPLVSPKSEEKDPDTTLTPCASPNNEDHLKRLEMSLEKNLQLSPRNSENSMGEDNDLDEYDESLRIPKVNSHGKVKTFKCKQCDHVANTKVEQWTHSAVHIREDKILNCPKCPFVTEYKHHLEYHLRNHAGSKPYQCEQCEYSCVNKSMLNSHMKSHSSIYRFSCRDCSYATKYCHSLKLHLRRYGHIPSVVLDENGKPCPDYIIDVYGTRRGPKVKSQPKNEENRPEPQSFALSMLPGSPFPGYPFFGGFPNAQILHHLIRERQALTGNLPETITQPVPEPEMDSVLDLSKPGSSGTQMKKNRRKGPAFKMDTSAVDSDDDDTTTTMFSNVEAIVIKEKVEESPVSDTNNNKEGEKSCQYCNILFGDEVLYSIHMGYHGFKNPFTCNMCGVECRDKVAFYLHIARVSHN